MVKLKLLLLIFLPFAILIALGLQMAVPSEKDLKKYQELVDKSQAARRSKKNPYVATQYREGVTKDLYYQSGGQLLQARIAGEQSKMVFNRNSAGMEILEYLAGLSSIIQKERFYTTKQGKDILLDDAGLYKDRKGSRFEGELSDLAPMQLVRYIVADEALYNYNKEELVADSPTIIEYRMEGHLLSDKFHSAKEMMRGRADHIELSFKDKPSFVAEGNVKIEQQQLFSAEGHRAEYQTQTVLLLPQEEQGHCSITTPDGLKIQMKRAVYLPGGEEIVLINPVGEVGLRQGGGDRLNFQADQLLWNSRSDLFTLIDHVKVDIPGVFSLVNSDRLSVKWVELEGKKVVSAISSTGKSRIEKYDDDGESSFIIESEGTTSYDLTEGKATIISDVGQEIHYTDRLGHLFGRELFIDLQPAAFALRPRKIYLNNQVKLLAGVVLLDGKIKGATQYALADFLLFDPKEKTLEMESPEGRRVLFCDRTNRIQMSAPKLVMRKNSALDRPFVKGVGDVRFRLKEEELDQIKKRFSLDEGK